VRRLTRSNLHQGRLLTTGLGVPDAAPDGSYWRRDNSRRL